MSMEINDLSLRLCSNKPIYVDGIPIYPISIDEIAEIGYSRFNAEMRLLCLTDSDIRVLVGADVGEVGVFTFLVANALKDKKIMEAFLFWLSKITRSKVVFSEKRMCFTNGVFEITKDNFEEFQTIVRNRNGMQQIEEDEENPDNEAARRVLQRRKEERIKRRRAKMQDEDLDITLSDLVSILASGLGMSMEDVMKYDLYQFNDQFNRLKIMDDYEVSVQALLHGAKKEDVNFTHWITKIKRDADE